MSFTRCKNIIVYDYKIKGETLSRVKSVKDLGVVFDPELTFSCHISQLTQSCYKLLGFIIRTCKQFDNQEAMLALFKGILRSKLEYASDVWAPYHQKYIDMLEQIQKKFLRYVYMRKHGTYPRFMHHIDLLEETDSVSLETRRKASLAILSFKIWNNFIDSPFLLGCYDLYVPDHYSRSRHHDLFKVPNGRTDVLAKHSMTRGVVLLNEIANHLDLITLLIGANDVCSYVCYDKSPFKLLERHRKELLEALLVLKENLPRTLVNLVPAPDVPEFFGKLKGTPPTCDILHTVLCSCLFGAQSKRLDKFEESREIAKRWQQIDIEMENAPELHDKEDFAVVLQPFDLDIALPHKPDGQIDFSLLSTDCFHFSQKGLAWAANALWNNMLQPPEKKQRNWNGTFINFLCPTVAFPYIYTSKNAKDFKNTT